MNQEQNTEIQNYKAQYNSILGNISIAKKELESALLKHKEAVRVYEDIQSNIIKESKRLELIKRESEEKINSANIADKLSSERTEESNKFVEQNKQYVADLLSNINTNTEKYDSEIREKKLLIDSLENKVKGLNLEIDFKVNKVHDITNEYNELLNSKQLIEEENRKSIRAMENQVDRLTKELAIVKAEKDKAIEERKIAYASLDLPRQELNNREFELNKRERNIMIMKERVKKEFKKLYPNQEPNI